MISGNEFHMCAPGELSLCFKTLLCLGYEHKDCLFCELDLESDKIYLSQSLNLGHLRS